MPTIPQTTAEATPAFVTAALREGGVIGPGTCVAEVEHETIGEGVGIVGQLGRLTLRYDGQAEGAPSSVILKMPSQFPENRAVGDHFNFYEREGRFYQQIGDKAALRTPHCWFNHIDPAAGEFALLLEDFGGRTLISQVAGVDEARARQAVEAAALIHAEWWNSPSLDSLEWMPNLDDPINMAAGQQYRDAWPLFVERMADALPEGAIEAGERIKEQWEANNQRSHDGAPRTVVHGDYRIDNLMFDDRAEGRDRVGVIDWQIAFKGPGLFDVCYLLTQSMNVDDRRACEQDLVGTWFSALSTAMGDVPSGFTEADAWELYRRLCLGATVYPVTSAGAMDPANERGRQLVEAMAVRSFQAVLDLDALELLPG